MSAIRSLTLPSRIIFSSVLGVMFLVLPCFASADSQTELDVVLQSLAHELNSTQLSSESHRAPNEVDIVRRPRTKYSNRRLLVDGLEKRDYSIPEAYKFSSESTDDTLLVAEDKGQKRRITYSNRRSLAPNTCTNKDISIFQGRDGSSGIPQYVVQIVNTCMSDCAPSDIHVFCGWFASALLVNPNTFRRLSYNDCLVNGDVCTNKDISISQSRDGFSGIPRYSVQIVNTCMSDCAPGAIHVYCGWFASSPPPNPNVFKRIAFNDCLVNGGRPLMQGGIIQFQYANSFMYPLRFRSAEFCR